MIKINVNASIFMEKHKIKKKIVKNVILKLVIVYDAILLIVVLNVNNLGVSWNISAFAMSFMSKYKIIVSNARIIF